MRVGVSRAVTRKIVFGLGYFSTIFRSNFSFFKEIRMEKLFACGTDT